MNLQPKLGWSPKQTWVIVVGTLEWKYPDFFSPFPQENRRDAALVDFFRTQGVPQAQITHLVDSEATSKRIKQVLETQLASAQKDDLLVLYYCGHGYKTDDGAAYFASYDADDQDNPGWLMDSVPATIERHFRGSRAMLIIDCCYSGSLADAVAKHAKRVAYACLASSLASESSTGNWTFTEGLLYGLRGLAFVDDDSNNAITLRELAAEIAESMAFAEEQVATFSTTKSFDPNMIMAAARRRTDPRIGKRIEAYDGDAWYLAQIIDARGEQVKVHYYGYEESDDEWLTEDNIREVKRESYPVGAQVEVKWKKKWYPARVVEALPGIHHIQYDEYGPEWNEWVASARIRPAS